MAKQKKGGLGRGLNSLLGVEEEVGSTPAPTTQEPAAPEPVKAEPEKETAAPQEQEASNPVEAAKEESAPVKQEEPQTKEEINSNIEEENVTIKSVVERPIARKRVEVSSVEEQAPAESEVAEDDDSEEMLITMIKPNPNQPRTNFKKQELEELSESIKQNGLLQPILVRQKEDYYEIIAGERRWQASKLAGLEKVPVRILDVTDDEAIVIAIVENVQRSDLNPIEEAYGYRRMMERGKMTQSQVAQAVSKGRSTIANSLRLLELPEEAQKLLFEEKITAGHARAILSVPTKEGRAKLADKLANEQLSVRETEAIARLMSATKESRPVDRPKTPKSYKTVARSLGDTLQTDVRIKSTKGKNKIEISFKDEADLERLFRLIVPSA